MTRFAIDWWRCMGIWRWPNLALVGLACWLAFEYEAVPDGWINHGARSFGDLRVTLRTRGRIKPGEPFEIMLDASDTASMLFEIGGAAREQVREIELSTDESLELTVDAPVQTDEPLFIVLTDERENSACWSLGRLYDQGSSDQVRASLQNMPAVRESTAGFNGASR